MNEELIEKYLALLVSDNDLSFEEEENELDKLWYQMNLEEMNECDKRYHEKHCKK